MKPTLNFKDKLRAQLATSLVNVDYPSAGLAHFVGRLGVDAIMIDCEQGSPSFEDVEHLTRAARLAGTSAIVRIPSPEPWTIERYVMRDIDGVVVPRLDTAAQVRKAVADIRYASPKDFHKKSVIVQVESVSAVEELDGFLAVDEVDCFFIGAVDLSKSMGFEGDYSVAAVRDVIDDVIRRIRNAGKSVGFLVKEHDTRYWQDRGATMLYTHVNDFLSVGAAHWRKLAGLEGA